MNNDDEMPPMLEADGDIPLWHRSPVESPEPVAVMEVSFPLYLFFYGWLACKSANPWRTPRGGGGVMSEREC